MPPTLGSEANTFVKQMPFETSGLAPGLFMEGQKLYKYFLHEHTCFLTNR